MNSLDRDVAAIIAEYLDPRYAWEPVTTPTVPEPQSKATATPEGEDRPATPPAPAEQHAA